MFQRTFVGAVLALLAIAAPAARADDPTCRGECLEARRICHRAAHAAHAACQDRCAETVQSAISRVREICLRETLGPRECALRIREATYAASLTCRTDCWQARGRAGARCGEEILECQVACKDLDPACVQPCRSEAVECRADLGECAQAGAAGVRERVTECRAEAQQICKVEGFRSCVLEARHSGARCVDECHATLQCGGELRECLGGCTPAD